MDYNDLLNLTFTTSCSHDEFSCYSVEERNMMSFDSPFWNNSITRRHDQREPFEGKCTYQIEILMTQEMNDHLLGIVFITSRQIKKKSDSCYSLPLRYGKPTW